MRGLFDTWRLVANGSFRFCEFVGRSKEESNVRLVVVRADATEEGDAVLWAQFLNQTLSVNAPSHERLGGTYVGEAPVLLQPLVLTQNLGIRSAGGVFLEALPQEIIEEGRNRFRNGGLGVFHDTEHNCSRNILASTS